MLDFTHAQLAAVEALIYERSLYKYLEASWPVFDPSPFTGGWHLECLCEHLQAVSRGEIKKLLINISPRSSKTSAIAVAYPTWTWAQPANDTNPLVGPGVRFLCASYGANKAKEDGVTARRVIASEWYQARWGNRVIVAPDRDNQERYDTTAGGSRISTGVPESLGKGGMIRIIDDPHKTDEVESVIAREAVIRAYKEIWSTRSNDPAAGAEIIVMQRQAENDLSGYVLDTNGEEWVHVCIPARFDSSRRCSTKIGWRDPRTVDGESFWPARFTDSYMLKKEREMGPFGWAGQFMQAPAPRGGGIIKSDWWKVWPPAGEVDSWIKPVVDEEGRTRKAMIFPDWDYVLASVDGAYTEKQENDYCACTVWGVFRDRAQNPRVMLIEAWRERLDLFHFVQRILDTCRRRKIDALLIEGKASGISAAQEVRRLSRDGEWQTILIDPKGDKAARLHATVPLFVDGVVFAPERKWAEMVITEVSQFPKGQHDDLVDTVSMGLNWLRKIGLAQIAKEHVADELESRMFHGNKQTVSQGYGV